MSNLTQAATLIERDCCESEAADPDDANTICINVADLRTILENRLATPTLPAVAAEPSDEQIRAAFRDYDARTGSPTHNTAWQSWRDACKWLLALRQGTAAPASVPAVSESNDDVAEALNFIDDFIARCNGDDRGACEPVNVLRRALATPTDPKASALEKDAARYRWLRENVETQGNFRIAGTFKDEHGDETEFQWWTGPAREYFDEMIDREMTRTAIASTSGESGQGTASGGSVK